MKKTFLLLIMWLSSIIALFAQDIPEFEMPLYFKDAIGNLDTLIVGYDVNATSSTLNPNFGEVALTEPFDSVFEVRALHSADWDYQMSKKIIAHYDHPTSYPCGISNSIYIPVMIKHLPLLVSWNHDLLNASICRSETIMTNSPFCLFVNCDLDVMEVESIDYYCLAPKHTFTEDFYNPIVSDFFYFNAEVLGVGDTTLGGFLLVFRPGWGCGYEVDVESVNALSKLSAYPNPAADLIHITLDSDLMHTAPNNLSVRLVNAQGSTFACSYQRDSKSLSIDIAHLPSGFYIGQLQTEQLMRTFKFHKW